MIGKKKDVGDSHWFVQVCDITGRWDYVKSIEVVNALEREGVVLHQWDSKGLSYEGAVAVMDAIRKHGGGSSPYLRGLRRRPQRVYNNKTDDFVLSDILYSANPVDDLKSFDEETMEKNSQKANNSQPLPSPRKNPKPMDRRGLPGTASEYAWQQRIDELRKVVVKALEGED